ncbi:hypothetical protein ACUVP6_00830 [Acinetobacter beijerinckii]
MNLRSTLIGVLYDFSLLPHSCNDISLCNAPKYNQKFKQIPTTHYFRT